MLYLEIVFYVIFRDLEIGLYVIFRDLKIVICRLLCVLPIFFPFSHYSSLFICLCFYVK